MVTGGNVTGLTDQLVAEGFVERTNDAEDRRALIVKLTAAGRKQFLLMAQAHEAWLVELLDGFDAVAERCTVRIARSLACASGPSGGTMNNTRVDPALVAGNRKALAAYRATHFAWACEAGVATVTLNRPERKNPLTFESYAELRDLFRALKYASDVHVVVIHGAGDNFCSGGDVHEIIGPLVQLQRARAADVHPHDRRPRQRDARLPAADHRRGRWRVRRRRRDRRHGQRHAAGYRAQQDRVPVQPRRPGRLRHGRVRDPAAVDRPGPRQRVALHRPLARRRGGRALGVSSTAWSIPLRCCNKRKRWRAIWLPARRLPTASPRPCCTRSGA